MFISADTPVSALQRTYEHFQDEFDDAPAYADYISYACDWLPDLRWALIPLEGETGWSIFAAAPGAEDLLEKVRTEFRRKQIPTAHLAKEKDRFQWVDD